MTLVVWRSSSSAVVHLRGKSGGAAADDRRSIFYPLPPDTRSCRQPPWLVVQRMGWVHPEVSSQGGRRDHDRQGGSRERGGPLE
jgi:hypothetical protein